MPLDRPGLADFVRARVPRDLSDDEGHLAAVREHIVTYGWHVQAVFAAPGRLGWSYTIGFVDTMGVPDLVTFGLPHDVANRLLNDIGDAIVEGRTFEDDHRYAGFLVDADVQFKPVLAKWRGAHFGRAADWYDTWPEMRQVVIPDIQNRMPGEEGSEAERFQMLLYTDAPAPRALSHEHTPIAVKGGHRALAADHLGEHPTGWDEELVVVEGRQPDRAVVMSVPFVDDLVFGDEVEIADTGGALRISGVSQSAPLSTVRCCVLRGGDETKAALDDLLTAAEQNEVVWESPVAHWFFFGVPHHRFDWFERLLQAHVDDGLLSTQTVRRPPDGFAGDR